MKLISASTVEQIGSFLHGVVAPALANIGQNVEILANVPLVIQVFETHI